MDVQRRRRAIGMTLFILGLLLTAGLTLVATLGDLEADFYGFPRFTQKRLHGLDCPVLMAADERPLISARVTNMTPATTNISMRADFSGYATERTESQLVPYKPGETKTTSWPFSSADAVYGDFVLVKVYMGGTYPMPPAEGTCGVYMLSLRGVSGMAVYWSLFALGLIALVAGTLLLERPEQAYAGASPARARRFLAVTAVLGLYFSYIGLWPFGLLALMIMLILVMSLVFQPSKDRTF